MDQQTKEERWKVIVVGAGIAGLTTARELQKRGITALVLQASYQIGGRTITEKVGEREIDLGATMIHGIGPGDESKVCKGRYNPIFEIAREAKIKTTKLFKGEEQCEDVFYDQFGKDLDDEFDFDKTYERAYKFFLKAARKAKPEESVADYIGKFIAKYGKDEQQYAFRSTKSLFNTYGADLESISMYMQDRDSLFYGHEAVFPNRGHKDVIEVLSKGLDIKTDHAVTQIEDSQEGVKVTCENGKIFRSDYVAITVSLGVLKAKLIQFSPELPLQKVHSIDKIGFTNYHKIYIEFESKFWDTSADFLMCANGYEFMNIGKYLKIPALILFCQNELANEFEKIDDTQAIKRVVHTLETVFGKASDLTLFIRTKWGQKKYIRGAYSFPQKGQLPKDVDELKKSVRQRLFFGGEATCFEFVGCTSAALLSGERVSRQICKVIGTTPQK